MKKTYETGLTGEKLAEEWLCRHRGMVCLERRYRTKRGEIDLIMQENDMIVFVEVKTRKTGDIGLGLMAVTPAKQKRLTQAATLYLMYRHSLNAAIRFDVVEVRGDGSVIHVPNAFQSTGMFYR